MNRIVECPSCATKLKLGATSSRKSAIACPACGKEIGLRTNDGSPQRPAAQRRRRPSSTARRRPRRDVKRIDDELLDDFQDQSRQQSQPETHQPELPPPPQFTNATSSGSLAKGLLAGGVAVAVIGLAAATYMWLTGDNDAAQPSGSQQFAANEGANPQPGSPVDAAAANPNPFPQPGPAPLPDDANQPQAFANKNDEPPAAVIQRNPGELSYGLKFGDYHVYNYELTATIDGKDQHYPGNVSFDVREGPRPKRGQAVQGSGTGFLVTSDGYLLTCHHVIEGATEIEAVVDGTTYPAHVIAFSRKHDTAIVKIDGRRKFPVVPLGDSDAAQLAEDIRAFGYPLTDLLGSELKVNKGSISGVTNRDKGKRFQIDASINPGNSGGPLVNGQGQVIGVNSAKLLSGSSISSVGFSVPIAYAKQLLQKNNVQFLSKTGGPQLPGPKIAATFAPAMVLLKVESRKQSLQQFVLNYSGSYKSPQTSNKNRGRMGGLRGSTSPKVTSSDGKVVLDRFGKVSDYEDKAQLPFTTGSMAMLMVHRLDPDADASWSYESKFQLSKPRKRSSGPFGFDPFGAGRFGRPGFAGPGFAGPGFGEPQQGQPEENLMDCTAVHRYRIVSSNANEVVIHKQHELRTLDSEKEPNTLITGKGTITFDKRYSMPRAMEYQQTFEQTIDGVRVKIPIRITYQLKDPALLQQERQKSADRLAKFKAAKAAEEAKEAAMSDEERVEFLLTEIGARRHRDTYKKLAAMNVVPDYQDQVLAMLSPMLDEKIPRQGALEALGKWATPEVVKQMIDKLQSLDDRAWSRGIRLMAGLANSGDKRAAEPIAARLGSGNMWQRAARDALIKLGPDSEAATLRALKTTQITEVCEVLGEIGTLYSVKPLQLLRTHRNHLVSRAAVKALEKIAARGN